MDAVRIIANNCANSTDKFFVGAANLVSILSQLISGECAYWTMWTPAQILGQN